jgi:hypothetical protein
MEHILHLFGIGGSCGEHTIIPGLIASAGGIAVAVRFQWHRIKAGVAKLRARFSG